MLLLDPVGYGAVEVDPVPGGEGVNIAEDLGEVDGSFVDTLVVTCGGSAVEVAAFLPWIVVTSVTQRNYL